MTTDKLIAEIEALKADDSQIGFEPQDYKQYCRTRNFAISEVIEIIRNHQPEPTQKQVNEEKIIELMARKMEPMTFTVFDQVESGEYKPAPGYNEILSKIQECREYSLAAFSAFRPYLRQVDNVGGEPQQVSGNDLTHDLYHSLSWLYEVTKVSDTNYAAVTNAAAIMSRYETVTRTLKKQPVKVDELIAKIDKASQTVSELCNGTRKWIMSIPARIDYDPDIIISDALYSAKAALQTPQPATVDNAELEKVREALEGISALARQAYAKPYDYTERCGIKAKEALAILDKLLGKTTKGEQK